MFHDILINLLILLQLRIIQDRYLQALPGTCKMCEAFFCKTDITLGSVGWLAEKNSLSPSRHKLSQNYSCTSRSRLGKGSFGAVYKGTLRDGCCVAIKAIDMTAAGAGFEDEVSRRVASRLFRRLVYLRTRQSGAANHLDVVHWFFKCLTFVHFRPYLGQKRFDGSPGAG